MKKRYTLGIAIMRNKDLIKTELAIIGGLNIMPPFDMHTLLVTAGVGLFVFVTKMAADAVDFFTPDIKK